MALPDSLQAWAARKRREIVQLTGLEVRRLTPSTRDFSSALRFGRRDLVGIPTLATALEAEAEALAAVALAADAAAVAVSTDATRGGSLSAMQVASEGLRSAPVLRLDLVLAEAQVYETRLAGGDALLLPAALLSPRELQRLGKASRSTLMTPICLLQGQADWEAAREAGARHVLVSAERPDGGEDLEAALALCERIPPSVSVCLAAASLDRPEAVRALLGRVDGALLAPAFPSGRWREVAVVEPPG
jgi:indole-3-glycerol phosphate synthase